MYAAGCGRLCCSGGNPAEFRLWKDDTGMYSVEAVLVEIDGNKNTVLLRKRDGRTVQVPIARLSQADQEYLRSLAQPKPGLPPKKEGPVPPGQPAGRQRLGREELLRRVEPAVVRIETDRGAGSGFFVDRDLVVTNYHVIKDASEATAKVGEETYRILGFLAAERGKDLALLRVDRPQGGPHLPIASELPEKLEEVYAFGSPLGLQGTVTRGEVSAVRTCREIRQDTRRTLPVKFAPELDDDLTLIQTTAPISPGNSGGPLLNSFGEVVGVNTLASSAFISAQNVNFAIACVDVKAFVARSKGNPLRPLASLMPPQVKKLQAVQINPSDLQVPLPDGEVFSLKSLIPAEKDIDEKFVRAVDNTLQSNITDIKLQIPDIGYVLTGIYFRQTGPSLFGLPHSYAFVWKEKTQIREEKRLVDILGGSHDRALLVVEERTIQTPVTSLIPVGVFSYERGKLHGLVNIYLNEKGLYLGVWDRGKPSEKQAQSPKDLYPKGMFVLLEGGSQWTLLKRVKGVEGQLLLLDGTEILRSFDSLDKALADPEGKSKWNAFQQAETTLTAMGEEIAKTCQREAKAIQQKVIALLQLQTRAENIQRSAEQRAQYAAAVEAGFRAAARRSGW